MWCYYACGVGHASGMGVGVYALLGHHISLTLMWCYYACGVGHAFGMGVGWWVRMVTAYGHHISLTLMWCYSHLVWEPVSDRTCRRHDTRRRRSSST